MKKLKTKLEHTFEIESDSMESLDFNFDIQTTDIKKSVKVITVKKKQKKNGTTGLF